MRVGELDFLVTTTILERESLFQDVVSSMRTKRNSQRSTRANSQTRWRTVECPTGEVMYFHNGKTKAMVQAVREIEDLNRQALLGRKVNEMFMVRGRS